MEKETKNKIVTVVATVVILVVLYVLAHNVSTDALKNLGSILPLPVFTMLIGLVDGFNPCNLFVLTLLLTLMISASHSKKRILIVGYTFIVVVYAFYYLFMAAWLNIFKYIGFVTPLRYLIAIIALIAGLINMKELFFFRQGVTLMVQPKHARPLRRRIEHVAGLIKKGSMPTLIGASVLLAVFSSLVELPCTAGFPIIYVGILSGRGLETTIFYYAYLILYNLFYVLPLIAVITVFGLTLHGKQISHNTMAIIKFIGGAIMFLLGVFLIANPGLLGV